MATLEVDFKAAAVDKLTRKLQVSSATLEGGWPCQALRVSFEALVNENRSQIEYLKGVSVGPVLLEGGTDALRDELAEPEAVLHALGARLLLLDGRLFDEQPLHHVDALLNGRLLLVHHLHTAAKAFDH